MNNKIHILKIVVPVDGGGNRISIPQNERQSSDSGRKGKTAGYASCHKTINDKLTIHYGLAAGKENSFWEKHTGSRKISSMQ